MNKETLLQRLKEDKFFDNPDELIEYRLPCIQWYLNNIKMNININGQQIDFSKITIVKPDDYNFPLMNQAFESLKNRIGEF